MLQMFEGHMAMDLLISANTFFFTFEILKFLTKVNTLQISYKLGVCDIGKSTFMAACLEGIEAVALRVWKWRSCC